MSAENLAPWQLKYLDYIIAMSNEDLLDHVVSKLCDTDEDCWRFHASETELHRRLADWLKEDNNGRSA